MLGFGGSYSGDDGITVLEVMEAEVVEVIEVMMIKMVKAVTIGSDKGVMEAVMLATNYSR